MDEELKKQKQREYQKRYYEKNKEKIKEYHRKYYQECAEMFREERKEYYKTHKEQIYTNNRKWEAKNKERFSKLCQESRRRRVERLRTEGVTNAWSVVNSGKEPKYMENK